MRGRCRCLTERGNLFVLVLQRCRAYGAASGGVVLTMVSSRESLEQTPGNMAANASALIARNDTPLAILRCQPADSRRLFRCLEAHLPKSPFEFVISVFLFAIHLGSKAHENNGGWPVLHLSALFCTGFGRARWSVGTNQWPVIAGQGTTWPLLATFGRIWPDLAAFGTGSGRAPECGRL